MIKATPNASLKVYPSSGVTSLLIRNNDKSGTILVNKKLHLSNIEFFNWFKNVYFRFIENVTLQA